MYNTQEQELNPPTKIIGGVRTCLYMYVCVTKAYLYQLYMVSLYIYTQHTS